MRAIFITGTDTGVGKTVVTGLLARFLMRKNFSVITQKWIQSGSKKFSDDIDTHLKLMKRKRGDIKEIISRVAPYTFKYASSPHLASALEGKRIDVNKIESGFNYLSKKFDFVIVESAGGSLVPISKRALLIDIARKLHLPVIIVVNNRLGAINHTLLTVEAIKVRNMKIIGILFNRCSGKGDDKVLEDNPRIIQTLSKERVLGELPYSKNTNYLYKKFIPAGNKILSCILKVRS